MYCACAGCGLRFGAGASKPDFRGCASGENALDSKGAYLRKLPTRRPARFGPQDLWSAVRPRTAFAGEQIIAYSLLRATQEGESAARTRRTPKSACGGQNASRVCPTCNFSQKRGRLGSGETKKCHPSTRAGGRMDGIEFVPGAARVYPAVRLVARRSAETTSSVGISRMQRESSGHSRRKHGPHST